MHGGSGSRRGNWTGKQDGGQGDRETGQGDRVTGRMGDREMGQGGTGGQGNGTGGTGKQDEISPCEAAPCLRIAWLTGACLSGSLPLCYTYLYIAPPKVPTDELSENQLRKIKDKLKTHVARWENIAHDQGLHFRAGEPFAACLISSWELPSVS